MIEALLRAIKSIEHRLGRIERHQHALSFVPQDPPLTSTSWDGDARSTTAVTVIDLSAVFGVPAGAKAVSIFCRANDSGSAASDTYIGFTSSLAGNTIFAVYLQGTTNDVLRAVSGIVSCDTNGDIFFFCAASGAGTLDVTLRITGYWI